MAVKTASVTLDGSNLRFVARTGSGHSIVLDDGVRTVLAQDDVAGQKRAGRWLRHERAMGERWIAGPEDEIGRTVDIQLRLHRRLDVDLGEDAEAFGSQGGLDGRARRGDAPRQSGSERVAGRERHVDTSDGARQGCTPCDPSTYLRTCASQ